jgi:hypothetical protein
VTALSEKSVKSRNKWLQKLSDEDKAHKPWRARAKAAEDEYCIYDKEDTKNPPYALFATTISLIHGRIYGQPPRPDVRKRHPSSPQNQPAQAPMGTAPPQMGGGQPAMPTNTGMPQGQPGMPQMAQPGNLPGGNGQLPGSTAGVPDPVADDNTIAMCLERCISYAIETTLFDNDAHMAVNDFLIAALGQCKVEMETDYEKIPVVNPLTGQPILDEEGQPLQTAQITNQEIHLTHFSHSQFRWEPRKSWRKVGWISFDHNMTRDDIEDQFNVKIEENSSGPSNGQSDDTQINVRPPQMDKYESVYVVHEIWDKAKRKRVWVTECYADLLDEEDDPLGLDDFYPCPKPMMANVNGRDLVPNPDYWQYASLCKQANELARRINIITENIKDIGFYDTSFGELKKINQHTDGTWIAVKDLLAKVRAMNDKASLDAILIQVPMADRVAVLQLLRQELIAVKEMVYEINGIPDIQRGITNPNDTATAQNIKNEWADIRTGQRVQVVALFFRDIFRLFSEIIATKFEKSQIEAMSGIALTDMQMATMRSDLATGYSVDVESDSTMVQNDSQSIADLTAFLQAFEPLLQNLLPGMQSGAVPAGLGTEILNMVVDKFKAGRDLQQQVESLPSTLQQLNQLTQQAQQATQHAQQLQQQLDQMNQADEARKNAQTQAEVQSKAAQAGKTQTETQLLTSDLPKKAADTSNTQADAALTAANAAIANRQNTSEAIMTGIQ